MHSNTYTVTQRDTPKHTHRERHAPIYAHNTRDVHRYTDRETLKHSHLNNCESNLTSVAPTHSSIVFQVRRNFASPEIIEFQVFFVLWNQFEFSMSRARKFMRIHHNNNESVRFLFFQIEFLSKDLHQLSLERQALLDVQMVNSSRRRFLLEVFRNFLKIFWSFLTGNCFDPILYNQSDFFQTSWDGNGREETVAAL